MREAVVELARTVIRGLVDPVALAEAEATVLAAIDEPFRDDPSLIAEALASTRHNFEHWARSMHADPYAPVAPALAPSVIGIAREAVRRGAERAIYRAYQAGRVALWRQWMRGCFAACDDPAVLAEALELGSDSLTDWIDATVRELIEQIDREHAELTRGSAAQTFEAVNAVLAGATTADLTYPLSGAHLAAVLWTDAGAPDQTALRRAADALRVAAGSRERLLVQASSASAWLWLSGPRPMPAAAELADGPVRLALGSPASGVEGFRRSHVEAVETQRWMLRAGVLAAGFADVALVSLAGRDEQSAREFLARVLGPLAGADADLRETVRVHIREQYSATRTAAALFTHRNTVLNRIHRAEALLPEPLERRGPEIAVALELDRWLGRGG